MKGLLYLLFYPALLIAQEFSDLKIDSAFVNAKKGVYWCLSNIPEKKTDINNDLISNDQLISSVRLQKEINGIRIESTGYFNAAEVKIIFFKSNDNLLKEGFIKPDSLKNIIKADVEKAAKKKKKKD